MTGPRPKNSKSSIGWLETQSRAAKGWILLAVGAGVTSGVLLLAMSVGVPVVATIHHPLTVDLPKAEPLDSKYLRAFEDHSRPLLARLDQLYADAASASSGPELVARIDTTDVSPSELGSGTH